MSEVYDLAHAEFVINFSGGKSMNSTEQWRSVPGWEGKYEVSDHGRVRCWIDSHGRQRQHPRLMTPTPHYRTGYLSIGFSKPPGIDKRYNVHVLVLRAFRGEPPPKHQAAHLDGTRTNNVLSNLVWLTPKENSAHKKIHGTHNSGQLRFARLYPERILRGEASSSAKLTSQQVREILRDTRAARPLAEKFHVSLSTIRMIRRGINWHHIWREEHYQTP